jgi:hypothetical protein
VLKSVSILLIEPGCPHDVKPKPSIRRRNVGFAILILYNLFALRIIIVLMEDKIQRSHLCPVVSCLVQAMFGMPTDSVFFICADATSGLLS